MRLCSFVASTALLASANCLSAPRRRRQPVSRGGPEPATRAIRKNLARALALPVAFKAASRVEPVRKLMAGFDRVRVGLVAGTVGAAILGGCYFIFSFCVMDALNQQDPQTAINTMNSINVVIVNPKFIAAFMGTPLVCCWLVAESLAAGVGSSTDVALMFGPASLPGSRRRRRPHAVDATQVRRQPHAHYRRVPGDARLPHPQK